MSLNRHNLDTLFLHVYTLDMYCTPSWTRTNISTSSESDQFIKLGLLPLSYGSLCTLGKIRTCNLLGRNQELCPVELRKHVYRMGELNPRFLDVSQMFYH